MKTTKDLSILAILAICLCLVFELSTYFLNFVFFLLYLIISLLLPRLSTRRQTLIGNILIFVLGAWLVTWLNEIMSPSFVLVFSFPFLFPQIAEHAITSSGLILLSLVPSFCLLVIFAYFTKGFKGTLFFLGASVVSILYAGWTLIQVAWLYYANVGWALPDINIEGYSFPAIYIFKLFRSLFLAASFTLLGHLSNIGILSKIVSEFRRKKEKRLTDFESHSEEASVKEVLNLHKDKGQIEGSKMSENRKVRRNKDADLLKIQIMADYYQANFSFVGSIVTGGFVGLFLVAITLRFENVLNIISYSVFLTIVMVFFLFYALRTIKSYHSDLEQIDNLFTKVENGETLPSIAELRKMKKE